MSTKGTKIITLILSFLGLCGSGSFAQENTINGHEYVDLGLSVKWATCNVNATSPSADGSHFAWGETKAKHLYKEENSITYKSSGRSDIAGNTEYDAARANWGATWRLPTKSEMEELVNDCKWEWVSKDSQNGYLVTGPSGNSIFLPASGWKNESSSQSLDRSYYGFYWSSTPDQDDMQQYSSYNLIFNKNHYRVDEFLRYYGYSIRPVTE